MVAYSKSTVLRCSSREVRSPYRRLILLSTELSLARRENGRAKLRPVRMRSCAGWGGQNAVVTRFRPEELWAAECIGQALPAVSVR